MRVFKEQQRFTQWWILLLIGSVTIIPVYGIIQQFVFDKPFGDHPMSNSGLLIFTIAMLFFIYFFFSLKLITRIDEIGIHYRFVPFHFSNRTIAWNTITSAKIRTYDAITEYGGWGLKSKFLFRKNKGISYSVSGNIGIQLELISKKKILIGTNKKGEVEAVLKTYSDKLASNEA
jgi:hypothetical protein